MGSFSIWHWLIVLAVVLILFGGGGKLSQLMGDFGKGLKSFKKSMKDEDGGDNPDAADAKVIGASHPAAAADAPRKDHVAKG